MRTTDEASGGDSRLDALLPPEMARRAEEVGVRKAAMDALTTFTLAVLAGAFIALGGVFATTALAGAGAAPGAPSASWLAWRSASAWSS
jgi:formate/nitrite transporter FocA (FNT family)